MADIDVFFIKLVVHTEIKYAVNIYMKINHTLNDYKYLYHKLFLTSMEQFWFRLFLQKFRKYFFHLTLSFCKAKKIVLFISNQNI